MSIEEATSLVIKARGGDPSNVLSKTNIQSMGIMDSEYRDNHSVGGKEAIDPRLQQLMDWLSKPAEDSSNQGNRYIRDQGINNYLASISPYAAKKALDFYNSSSTLQDYDSAKSERLYRLDGAIRDTASGIYNGGKKIINPALNGDIMGSHIELGSLFTPESVQLLFEGQFSAPAEEYLWNDTPLALVSTPMELGSSSSPHLADMAGLFSWGDMPGMEKFSLTDAMDEGLAYFDGQLDRDVKRAYRRGEGTQMEIAALTKKFLGHGAAEIVKMGTSFIDQMQDPFGSLEGMYHMQGAVSGYGLQALKSPFATMDAVNAYAGQSADEFSAWADKATTPGLAGYEARSIGAGYSGEAAAIALSLVVAPRAMPRRGQSNALARSRMRGEPEAGLAYKPVNSRHFISKVRQNSVARDKNTVIEPWVDFGADLRAINNGLATRAGDLLSINGRQYGIHPATRTLYPVAGTGTQFLEREAYKALGVLNKLGYNSKSLEIIKAMRTPDEALEAALKAWRTTQ